MVSDSHTELTIYYLACYYKAGRLANLQSFLSAVLVSAV